MFKKNLNSQLLRIVKKKGVKKGSRGGRGGELIMKYKLLIDSFCFEENYNYLI